MNSHQKYVTAMNVCKKIANTLSQSSQEDFDRKLGQLSSLNELWCNGREVGFQTFDDLANIDEAIEPIQSVRESPAYETVQSVIPDEPQSLSNTEVLNTDDKDASIDYVVKEVMKSLIENIDPIDSIDMEIERDDFQSLTISKIKSIKVPPTLKRKGRPKGSEKTNAIGLPKMPKSKKKKCQTFSELRNSAKEKITLSLCIGKECAEDILSKGGYVEIHNVYPTEIESAAFNPNVHVESIRYLFTPDAWERFYSYYCDKMHHLRYQCNSCRKSDSNSDDIIFCERCLTNFHYVCLKLKKTVRKRSSWFCNVCKAEKKYLADEVCMNEIQDNERDTLLCFGDQGVEQDN